jgi:hypothetical protein
MLVGGAKCCDNPNGCDRRGQYPGVLLVVCIVELYDGGSFWLPDMLELDHIVKRGKYLNASNEGAV